MLRKKTPNKHLLVRPVMLNTVDGMVSRISSIDSIKGIIHLRYPNFCLFCLQVQKNTKRHDWSLVKSSPGPMLPIVITPTYRIYNCHKIKASSLVGQLTLSEPETFLYYTFETSQKKVCFKTLKSQWSFLVSQHIHLTFYILLIHPISTRFNLGHPNASSCTNSAVAALHFFYRHAAEFWPGQRRCLQLWGFQPKTCSLKPASDIQKISLWKKKNNIKKKQELASHHKECHFDIF